MTGEFINTNQVWIPLLQGTAALALGLIGSVLLKRHAARAHHMLCWGLVATFAIPIMSLSVKHHGWGLLPAPESTDMSVNTTPILVFEPLAPAIEGLSDNGTSIRLERIPSTALATDASEAPALPPHSKPLYKGVYDLPWMSILLLIWAGVGLTLLIRLALTFTSGWHLLRAAVPLAHTDLQQAVARARTQLSVAVHTDLRESTQVVSPVIWCWGRRPVLLVQPEADGMQPPPDWVGLFCHELAHWKRRDHAWGLFAELAFCLLWWHPLIGWARHRLQHLSEHACDDWVLASGQVGPEYAESLLSLTAESRLSFLPTIIGKDKAMKKRIYRIIKNPCTHPNMGYRWTVLTGLIACGLIITTALAQPRMEPPERRDPPREDRDVSVEQRRAVIQEELQHVRAQIEDLERALEKSSHSDQGHHAAVEIRERLRLRHRFTKALIAELEATERLQWDRRPPEPGPRNEMEELEQITHQMETEIHELEELGKGHGDQAHVLRERLHDLHAKTEQLRQLQEKRPRSLERNEHLVRTRELSQELAHQEIRARQIELELKKLGDNHPDHRQKLQLELQKLHQYMEKLNHSLHQHAPEIVQPIDERLRELTRLGAQSAKIDFQLRELGDRKSGRTEQLKMEHQAIIAHMAELEHQFHVQAKDRALDKAHQERRRLRDYHKKTLHALQELGDDHPERARQLEEERKEISVKLKEAALYIHHRAQEKGMPPRKRPVREEDMPQNDRPNLENQVQSLNGQVDRLSREMQAIQKMLQQLIEQKEQQEQYR